MFSIIFGIASVTLMMTGFYLWKKYSDRNFLIISFFAVPVIFINILSFAGKVLLTYSILSFIVFVGIMAWYNWKKFNEKEFLWFLILNIILLVIVLLGLFL